MGTISDGLRAGLADGLHAGLALRMDETARDLTAELRRASMLPPDVRLEWPAGSGGAYRCCGRAAECCCDLDCECRCRGCDCTTAA